jgi:hypothetical protein
MKKSKVNPAQLSLWAEEEASTPAPANTTEKWYTLDEIIVRRERWADEEYSIRAKELQAQGLPLAEIASVMGYRESTILNFLASDSSTPAQLERLALAILGDLDAGFIGNDGMKHLYRCIATGIIDGQVLAAYQYERPARKSPAPPLEDDDID